MSPILPIFAQAAATPVGNPWPQILLQIVNVILLVHLFTVQSFWSVDAFMAVQFVGGASGVSGIVVAHELIHRRQAHLCHRSRRRARTRQCHVVGRPSQVATGCYMLRQTARQQGRTLPR